MRMSDCHFPVLTIELSVLFTVSFVQPLKPELYVCSCGRKGLMHDPTIDGLKKFM
jgi:hypothetical protein